MTSDHPFLNHDPSLRVPGTILSDRRRSVAAEQVEIEMRAVDQPAGGYARGDAAPRLMDAIKAVAEPGEALSATVLRLLGSTSSLHPSGQGVRK